MKPQMAFAFGRELAIDLFAGGGGASLAFEQAFGRHVDVAVNHDETAVQVHKLNHPTSYHYCEDVFDVDPLDAAQGPVAHLHLSPDCTHHSQAAGGQPRDREIRSLTWVGKKWAGIVRPRVITLENVEQILKWCGLIAKRDRATGRVVTLDRVIGADGRPALRVAEPGERVPLRNQFLIPDQRRQGSSWRRFVTDLRQLGYRVEWRKLKACDFGAGTTRERLFMVARCDGRPIVWPKPTHGPRGSAQVRAGKRQPYRAAADFIDWSLPCPSIFLSASEARAIGVKRPLADASLKRIAEGVTRLVIKSGDPFIVPVTHSGDVRVHDVREPLRTITAAQRGEFALVSPILLGVGGRAGQTEVRSGAEPNFTTTKKADAAVAVAYIEQANGGPNGNSAKDRDAREPLSTIVGKGSTQRIITAQLATMRQNTPNQSPTEPLRTISAGGEHHVVVEYSLSPEVEAGALRVAAFLMRYHGQGGQLMDLREPLTTATTRDRLALVTVWIKGEPWVIVDIGMRMLTPDELKLCQGFPADYRIDRRADGKPVTKAGQVRLVGNSVSPHPLRALIEANLGEVIAQEREASAA